MTNFQNIAGIESFTTLDFPNKLAAILFYNGCNIHCPYCYNDAVCKGTMGTIPPTEIEDFLLKRRGKLDGVVFSGGECTLQKHLLDDLRRIKEMGYLTKIDTNGTRPEVVRQAVEEGLVDYVALDIKCTLSNFGVFFPSNSLCIKELDTFYYLNRESGISFEVRTTVHTGITDEHEINSIIRILDWAGYKGTYYLQFFFETSDTLAKVGKMPRAFDTSKLETLGINVEFRNQEGNLCREQN